jgi:hypothetical protein
MRQPCWTRPSPYPRHRRIDLSQGSKADDRTRIQTCFRFVSRVVQCERNFYEVFLRYVRCLSPMPVHNHNSGIKASKIDDIKLAASGRPWHPICAHWRFLNFVLVMTLSTLLGKAETCQCRHVTKIRTTMLSYASINQSKALSNENELAN